MKTFRILAALLLVLANPTAVFAQGGPSWAGAAPVANSPICSLNVLGGQIFQCTGEVDTTRVVTAAGAVTVATSDLIVVVNKASGAATTVNLPATPVTGQRYYIVDGKGDAFTNNITVTPAAGNISGASTYVMNVNYQGIELSYNGTQWLVLSTFNPGETAILSATTSSIGGGALLAGACAATTVAVTGSTTAMGVVATPATYPGDGNFWFGYISTNGTATVKVCAAVAGTPNASTYSVRVVQ